MLSQRRSEYEPIGFDDDRYHSFPMTIDHSPTTPPEPDGHHRRDVFAPAPTQHEPDHERKNNRWGHVKDLDQFFTRIYEYHQRGGFRCMVLGEVFEMIQFVFLVFFSVFMLQCVDYGILFRNRVPAGKEAGNKTTIKDIVIPQCLSHINFFIWLCLIVAFIFFVFRLVRGAYQLLQYWEISSFYDSALKIPNNELDNMTWHQVLQRLCQVQSEIQLCIQSIELTPLDVYQRILRHKNYLVAMVNKELIPNKTHIPFAGAMTNGLKINLQWLLFLGPYAPWKDYYTLRPEFKSRERLAELALEMDKVVLWLGIVNLVLFPIRFLWLILYCFFSTAELVKREPGALGSRKWSNYGRYYFRHFNELDHELNIRLNRAYKPGAQFMDLFYSRSLEIVAKNISIFAGAFFVVLVILTSWDEDVLQIEHLITVMTGSGVVIFICKSFIQDENLVWCPEWLMSVVLSQVHYMPESWKGFAHTDRVRSEFGHLFEFRLWFVLEELLSPIITPFILLLWIRPRCAKYVEFFYKFTVTVPGLGDVCSFAQMDIRKHGDPEWNGGLMDHDPTVPTPSPGDMREKRENKAKCGKTEMSLVHFTLTNPGWRPPEPSRDFLYQLREQTRRDASNLNEHQAAVTDNPLLQSLTSLVPLQYPLQMSLVGLNSQMHGKGISHTEGPLYSSVNQTKEDSLLASLHQSGLLAPPNLSQSSIFTSQMHQVPQEGMAAEMSLHALYLHRLHDRRRKGPNYGSVRLELREMPEPNERMPKMPESRVEGTQNLWAVPEQSTSRERQDDTAPLIFKSS